METARQWRYYVGAVKVIVPEGVEVVFSEDGKTFKLGGFYGDFDAAQIESLLKDGWLRRYVESCVGCM